MNRKIYVAVNPHSWPTGGAYIAEQLVGTNWKLYTPGGTPFAQGHSCGSLLQGNFCKAGWIREPELSDTFIPEYAVGDIVQISTGIPNGLRDYAYSHASSDLIGSSRKFKVIGVRSFNGALDLRGVDEFGNDMGGVFQGNICPVTVRRATLTRATPQPINTGIVYTTTTTRVDKKEDEAAKLAEEGRALLASLGTANIAEDPEPEEEEDDYYESDDYEGDEEEFEEEQEEEVEDEFTRVLRQAEAAERLSSKKVVDKLRPGLGGSPFIVRFEDSWVPKNHCLEEEEEKKEELPAYARPENQVTSNYRPRAPRPLRSRGKKMF